MDMWVRSVGMAAAAAAPSSTADASRRSTSFAESSAVTDTVSSPAPLLVSEVMVAAQEANRRLAEKGSELTFEFDDVLGRVIFKLIDTRTREVVRQVPAEVIVAIARALDAGSHTGALLDADA